MRALKKPLKERILLLQYIEKNYGKLNNWTFEEVEKLRESIKRDVNKLAV